MTMTMPRGDVLDRLKANLQLAKAEDAKAKEKHEAEEQKYLEKFRDAIRAALKWDYKTAKNKGFEAGPGRYSGSPTCPVLEATSIAAVLEQVKLDTKDKYTFGPDSDIGLALLWKPASQRASKTVCD